MFEFVREAASMVWAKKGVIVLDEGYAITCTLQRLVYIKPKLAYIDLSHY